MQDDDTFFTATIRIIQSIDSAIEAVPAMQ
jgi:hypothetical protein